MLCTLSFGANPLTSHPSDRISGSGTTGEYLQHISEPKFAQETLREINGVLVDSSKTGWGLYALEAAPLASRGDTISMAYRKWVGSTGSSMILAVATSQDGGQTWDIQSHINQMNENIIPVSNPSVLVTEQYPIVLWSGSGASDDDASYAYDLLGYNGGGWTPPQGIYQYPESAATTLIRPSLDYDSVGNQIINIVYSDYLNQIKNQIRSVCPAPWDGTTFTWSESYNLMDPANFLQSESGNYLGIGNFDINDNGIGYFVLSGYAADTTVIENHTLFFKRTTDYGATWSDWFHLADEDLNIHAGNTFADSVWSEIDNTWLYLPQNWKPFIGYNIEIMSDGAGNLHLFTSLTPSANGGVYPAWSPACGLYQFLFDGNDLLGNGGEVSASIQQLVSSHSNQMYSEQGWWNNKWTVARDTQLAGHFYLVTQGSGTDAGEPYNHDLLGLYSIDGGQFWSDPINITQTPSRAADEMDPHLAAEAENGKVRIMYQVPNYDIPTTDPPDVPQDYMNYIYFWEYTFTDVVGVDVHVPVLPTTQSTVDIYPSPFNGQATFEIYLTEKSKSSIQIYDLGGRLVWGKDLHDLEPGHHLISWNAADFTGNLLPSGVYILQLSTDLKTVSTKMTVLK